ncbi:MAG: choice-of-anchor Q domain-containing protein [Phycisphaerae bacterium]|jgi:hypothetical protein
MRNPAKLITGVLFCAALGASTANAQSVRYVDDTATGADDGSSWCDAFPYLQDALAAAASSGGEIEELRIAQGTYWPDRGADQMLGDQTVTFHLINGVALRGGYAGCGAPDSDDRDIASHETVLSGDLAGDDTGDVDDPSRNENSFNVVRCTACDGSAVLDGVTVSGGNTTGVGGGMFNTTGAPTILTCTFTGNAADFGGAIANFAGSSPTIDRCTFSGNAARSSTGGGGAIYNYDGSSPTVTNCLFTANSADVGGGGGGAVRNSTDSSPSLVNCAFIANAAVYGGGMMSVIACNPTLVNCTFAANLTPVANGRALAFASSEPFSPSNAVLTNCILWNDGLEILSLDGSTITITHSDVLGGWPGDGNIDEDPQFVDPDGDDFRLSIDSPCIDAGDNSVVTLPTDLDENPRIVAVTSPTVDMGSYEFQIGTQIPTVSTWGLAVLVLLVPTAGTVLIRHRRTAGSG